MGEKRNLSAAEALYLAERMEARAVQLYERARVVFSLGALGVLLSDLAREERGHQTEFALLLEKEAPVAPERAMLLDAQAGNMLFEGGLTNDMPATLYHFEGADAAVPFTLAAVAESGVA